MSDKLKRRRTDKDDNDTTTISRIHGVRTETIDGGEPISPAKDSIRILVVIRQSIIRFGLATLLAEQSDFNVVGTAGNCAECCQTATQLSPDVLFCDLDIADTCPVEASTSGECPFAKLRDALPDMQTIALLDDENECQILQASRIGIRGYLTNNTSLEDLFQAIRVVKEGGTFLERRVQSEILGMLRQMNDGEKIEHGQLNDREQTILRLLAQGKRNQEIADATFLSNSSVKYYVSTLCTKLGASNRAEAVRIGISRNLIPAE